MNTTILQSTIEEFRSGRDLGSAEAEAVFDALLGETEEGQLFALFRAWDEKGIAADEIYSIAKIMRERCTKVTSRNGKFVDIVGTGGSRSKTFNVSTAAAFVVAGAGVRVAKHGNRAATSNSGSADVLSALGIDPAAGPETAENNLNKIGICFMFAPNFHRLSPTLAKVRRGLGFPTIFNCVGPLCNPASASHQVIGVWSREMLPKMAKALAQLGTNKSWIVHGENGLDEISLSGKTLVAEISGTEIRDFELTPEDFGVDREDTRDLRAESSDQSAEIVRQTLEANRNAFAARALVEINAAAAIFVSGHCESIRKAYEVARDSIRGGHAISKLNELVEASGK